MMMGTNIRIDETSCGQVVCQHPACWYSNRRVERGLPRTQYVEPEDNGNISDEELPTLKVLNMLGEYGYDPGDRYPTQHPLPRKRLPKPSSLDDDDAGRSHSAPVIRQLIDQPQQNVPSLAAKHMPFTPHQTPINRTPIDQTPTQSQGTPQKAKSPAKQRPTNKSAPARTVPFGYLEFVNGVKKVDMRESLGLGGVKHQGVIPQNGKVYVWCPGPRGKADTSQERSQDGPTILKVKPKDVTEDMIPRNLAKNQNKEKGQKQRKSPSFQTPTGGRPYTHPARSPPPLTRRTLPQDIDEGIAQLLQLPRDVLLELVEHTKESDLFDKNKVAMLLEKLMPHIHFEKNDVTQQHPPPLLPVNTQVPSQNVAPSAPLHSSGILRQKKVTLLDSRDKRVDPVRAPPPTRSMPFFLDESGMSGITSSSYTKRERPDHQVDEDRETTLISPTIASEELTKRKTLGPIRAAPTEMSNYSRRKMTSVSAKSLPPLQPGVRSIRPFNYTAQSFDLALSPLTTPDYEPSEKSSSPYSGRASTVYVTVPSHLSGHTPPQTPCTVCERTPIPPIPTRLGSAHYSTISTVPSDDFPELHWVDFENAIREGAPTHVFRVPYAMSDEVKQGSYPDDSPSVNKVLDQVNIVNLPPGSTIAPSSVEPHTPAAGDEAEQHNVPQDRPVGTASTDTRGTYSVQSSAKPPESNTHYDAATSVMAQASEKAIGSPLALDTPLPTAPTPEVWPVVDEREYMNSPERKNDRLSNKKIDMILAPVAPPPSPEPAGMDVDYDIQEMSNKSTATPSLTPLAEEEEEEEGEEDEDAGAPRAHQQLVNSPVEQVAGQAKEVESEETNVADTERTGTRSGDQETHKESVQEEQVSKDQNPEAEGQDNVDSNLGQDSLKPLMEEAAEDVPVASDSNQAEQKQPDQESTKQNNTDAESHEQSSNDQTAPT
ncbi:uncharacterized protein LOC121428389 isoform X2 [Lytechinus variegatus]|uniref:uncharacterized protein LOC121428389 isoform X2 n=1 Tax=Lytechinus variegatus TaxID=7654 RepID=UPI001BB1A2F5|nr:uncharacterized protein LOC121428389 isoform X2 [Lytechinus variegatus]